MATRLKSRLSLLLLAFGVMIAFAAVAMGFAVRADAQAAPTIQSDKADYAPGELVTLTGSGWQPGESVHIVVNDTYGATWSHSADVTADANGNITDSFNLPNSFVSDYDVTATGSQSGTATTTFTDGNVNVSGTVTDSVTGLPIQGATVTCTTSSGCNANFSTTTDASGNYSFSQATGNRLTFDTNGPVTLTLTASKTGYANNTVTLTNVNNNTTRSGANIALVPATKKLTVTKTGAGTGTVTSSPAGINCGATCSANFNNGQSVTLTATQGANSTFNGWSGGSGTLNNDGTYTVTMDADKSVTATFKANQAALNYTGPTNGTFGDKLTLSSSGGSGTGAVTYEATGTACNIPTSGADAGKLVITSGTGTCLVEVKKAGDNDYNAATSGPQTITVSKANQAALTVDDPDEGTFGDHLPITTSGGTTNGALSFDTGTSTACQIDANNKLEITSGTGTCSVTATKAADNNYNSTTSAAHSVTVKKADQAALTVDDPDEGTFGDHLPITTSGGTTNGALSFDTGTSTACQIDANNKLEITSGTGTCSVKATMAGNTNYNPVTSDAHSVTVKKANQAALTVDDPDEGTFGDHLDMTASGGTTNGTITFEVVSGSTACQIDANNKLEITSGTGTCSIKATRAGNDNYNPVTSDAHSVTVHKADQAALSVTSPNDGTFGDHLAIVTSGGSGDGALSFDTGTSTACQIDANNKLEITSGTGTCSVKATKAGNDNYNPVTSDAHSVTVHKAAPTITWNNPSAITYGTALSGTQLNATAKGVDNNNLAGSFSYSPAASTVLSATGSPHTLSTTFTPTNTADYTNANAQVSLTVNKADLTVTADNKSKVYGDPNPPLTGTLTGVVNGDNITANYTTTATQFSLAGTYPIVPQLNDPGNRLGNYNVTKNNGTLTVGVLSPKGFYQPIDMSTAQTTVYNSVKGGSTVPVKFELFKVANDPSTELRDTSYVNKFTATKLPTCTAGTEDAIEETVATGQTTLRFDTTGDQFIYNWATPKVSSTTCYKLTMLAADGTTQINAYFTLRK